MCLHVNTISSPETEITTGASRSFFALFLFVFFLGLYEIFRFYNGSSYPYILYI